MCRQFEFISEKRDLRVLVRDLGIRMLYSQMPVIVTPGIAV